MTSGMKQTQTRQETPGTVVFRAAFNTDQEAKVVLIDHEAGTVLSEIPFTPLPYQGQFRQAVAEGIDRAKTDYVFSVGSRIIIDPGARVIRGREHFGSMERRRKYQVRCSFPETDYDWGDDAPPCIPYDEVISYCLHVRGFTRGSRAKVKNPGTFLGLTEKIGYLKDLGINQIILMPCYEFEEIEERRAPVPSYLAKEDEEAPSSRKLNYWGFTKSWYFAPKTGYCATRQPDREFKTMVRLMHEAGIEVVMEFAFFDDIPEYMALEALRFWMTEYHVDGFNLMCRPSIAYMAAHDALLAKSKLMTGYFDPGSVSLGEEKQVNRLLANFNDGFKTDMRRILKGDADMTRAFVDRFRQSSPDAAWVNYMTAHDGFTMMDLVSYDRKHNEENGESGQDGAENENSWNCGTEGPTRKMSIQKLRLQQIRNAFAMLLLSRGTPMILAGDEAGNTQNGNNNPYCLDSPVTWLDWSDKKMSGSICGFVRELIAFRKAHPMLSRGDQDAGNVRISSGYPAFSCHSEKAWYESFEYQARHVGMMLCGLENGEESYIYIACNFHWDPQTLAIPYLPETLAWKAVIDTGTEAKSTEKKEEEILREITLPGRTIRVLVSEPKRKEQAEEA